MCSARNTIGIGLMGLGVIGGGVAKALLTKADTLEVRAGKKIVLLKVLERDLAKHGSEGIDSSLFTTDLKDILENPFIDIVIELIGGEHPAVDFIRQAMSHGKHVVTANKEVISKYSYELFELARKNNVSLRFEASVGGGIPVIAPFQDDLIANNIHSIQAIVNGTTNYILTRMAHDNMDFSVALKQAQKLGYAEADPTKDIEGLDAAYKIAILATLGFRTQVRPADVYCEGISRLEARDFRYARELGYAIKLLAIAKDTDGSVEARVHPVFLPEEELLAKVNGVYNAIQVDGDLVGRVIFYGQGAGASPTSSAVVADLVAITRGCDSQARCAFVSDPSNKKRIKPMAEVETRYYFRMSIADRPNVLAQISKTLGDNLISIASVIQKETDIEVKSAEIVIMTHTAREEAVQKALRELEALAVVKKINNVVRVEG